ncbi:MAG TPA: AAA family ATPase, partial [Chthonomonadaceae bacterium]|nr:AAA family ATPase [Chthonomonadaceae bacterium]
MMSSYPTHQKLALHNFTAFREARLEFVTGINTFVGENGTGKTHLLKALYAFQLAAARDEDIRQILKDLFQTKQVDSLVRQGTEANTVAQVSGLYGNGEWAYAIHPGDAVAMDIHVPPPPRPVFIPAIDMMGHTRGFLEAYEEVRLDFDRTCRDIVSLMGLERRNGHSPFPLQETLTQILGGDIESDPEGRYYLVTEQGRLPMPLVAEGLRKIATLLQLQRNGWLAPGAALFWDEPEVNLNPVLMDEVIGALLALARSGVQVFIATHSYVILREIEVQSGKSDTFCYFALFRTEEGVAVHPAKHYLDIDP